MMNKIKGILTPRPAFKLMLGSRNHVRQAHIGQDKVGIRTTQSDKASSVSSPPQRFVSRGVLVVEAL